MEDERRRKRGLTPLSGELETPAEWTPPGPIAEEYRPKEERLPPTTWKGAALVALRRFVIIVGALSALIVGVALLLVRFADWDASRAFPVAFYLGGAMMVVGGFMNAGGSHAPYYFEREERERAFNSSFVLAIFGVALVAVGILLDSLL